jgi:glyoxylase-like metal-dependent hydrolase (beta-lactamase superfamily II)
VSDVAAVSVRLHPIISGEIQLRVMNPRPPRRGPAKLPRTLLGSLLRSAHWYPVPVFLVEHPRTGPFLIDVGYDPSIASDPTRTLGFLFGKVAMKHRLAEQGVPDQVTSRSVDPADVTMVVMTHLHLDHISASSQWPQATFVVDRAERAAAARRGPGPYVRSHLATIGRWREIDYAGSEAKPFESFARTMDLLGDGTVRLVSSPGHSPGHQSVLLRLRDRYALICGDAAMSTLELREPLIDGIVVDQDSYVRSGEEAREFMRSYPDTLAIPSHDRELWSRLEPTYD